MHFSKFIRRQVVFIQLFQWNIISMEVLLPGVSECRLRDRNLSDFSGLYTRPIALILRTMMHTLAGQGVLIIRQIAFKVGGNVARVIVFRLGILGYITRIAKVRGRV